MRLPKESQPCQRPSRSAHLLADRVKALSGLPVKYIGFFVLFNILYGAVFASHLAQLFRFSLTQKHYSHFILVPAVSLYLLYTRRQELYAYAAPWARGGMALVLVGTLGFMLGLFLHPRLSQNDFLALTALGMVLIWVGGFVTVFGFQAARAVLFPLGFLLFAVPLPEMLLAKVITALQYGSVEVTDVLFRLTPVPVFRAGIHFTLPGLEIEVAEVCSSIRSSLALLFTGVLASHWFLRRWWSKSVAVLLVFPLAVFKNGMRIVALSLLTLYVDEGFMTGGLHTKGGSVFFALAVAILLPIIFGLRHLESKPRGDGS